MGYHYPVRPIHTQGVYPMIPLDDPARWQTLLDASAQRFLNHSDLASYRAIPPAERQSQLKALLEHPIAHFTPVNEVFFRARWIEALQALGAAPDLRLLEVATGDADMIPQAMQVAYPAAHYCTANLNERLNASFRQRTAALTLDIQLFPADASAIAQYLPPASVDVVAFQHGLNDVVQGILCAREGIDTTYADWMETLPAMIRILQREVAAGTLAEHAREPFLALMASQLSVLKPGGVIAMNHYQFQLDLDWGYPSDLWENFIPLMRSWLSALPGCAEVPLEGFHPQWWLFLRKD